MTDRRFSISATWGCLVQYELPRSWWIYEFYFQHKHLQKMFKRYLQFSCEAKNWCSKTTPVFVEAMQCETSSWSVPELSFRNATRATWTVKNGHEMHWNVKLTVTLEFETEEELQDWDQVWNSRETSSWIFLHAVAGLYLPSGTLQTENCEGTDCWSLPNLSSICRRCCPSKG